METPHLHCEEEKKSLPENSTVAPSMYPHSYRNRINVKAFTWSKNSYGLYDYETLNVTRNSLTVDPEAGRMVVYSSANEVQACSEAEYERLAENARPLKLALIASQAGGFFVKSCAADVASEFYTDRLWLVVRSLKVASQEKVRFHDLF